MVCPGCRGEWRPRIVPPVHYRVCPACGGAAVPLGRLARATSREFAQVVRAAAARGGPRTPRRCPLCTMHLVGFTVAHRGATYALDHCDQCALAQGRTGVNHLAHLGGAFVGVAFWVAGPDSPWDLRALLGAPSPPRRR